MKKYTDSLGEIYVDDHNLWGATTQRSLNNFKIGHYIMPKDVIYAIVTIKQAAAQANFELGLISQEKYEAIILACKQICGGQFDQHFPLSIFQTGSGTQTNMNVNEVIAHIASIELHPNDDVNKSQSSNDVFPTAMHIAIYHNINKKLKPVIQQLIDQFKQLELENQNIIKIGRTHLQDAVPMTFAQEFSGYRTSLENCLHYLEESSQHLLSLPLGATAVGTGINTVKGYKELAVQNIAHITNYPFICSNNLFQGLSMKDEVCMVHGSIKTLATTLFKIANDIRYLASGPRCGYGEIEIPANEPGSSIMPGKVNPTQCEALSMVCTRVLGNDTTISFNASQGQFELNTYMPVMVYTCLESIELLADSIQSFADHCVSGIKVLKNKNEENLSKSLMLATALNPHIGYDKASQCAKYAHQHNLTLAEALEILLHIDQETSKEWLDPKNMIGE